MSQAATADREETLNDVVGRLDRAIATGHTVINISEQALASLIGERSTSDAVNTCSPPAPSALLYRLLAQAEQIQNLFRQLEGQTYQLRDRLRENVPQLDVPLPVQQQQQYVGKIEPAPRSLRQERY
jgi:hypothetical protein